jgi:nicotinamidase-related amidase
LPPTVKLLEAARKSGVKVVYVRFTTFADLSNLNDPMLAKTHERLVASPLMSFDPAQDEPAPERRLQEVAQPVVEGSWGWENIEEVAPRENEPIVRKLRVDCFLQTNLDMILRSNGIRSFVIVGVGAERGIVPTVAHGQNLGYYPVVPADCINPTGPSFEATAVRFIGRYATMTTSEEILGIWNG